MDERCAQGKASTTTFLCEGIPCGRRVCRGDGRGYTCDDFHHVKRVLRYRQTAWESLPEQVEVNLVALISTKSIDKNRNVLPICNGEGKDFFSDPWPGMNG